MGDELPGRTPAGTPAFLRRHAQGRGGVPRVEPALVNDAARVITPPLADGFGPEWASAWGVDGIGAYAQFTFRGVVQRLRYIEPGQFMMGSPEGEPGRFEHERQHEVVLTKGYWLGETACTQALWEAVTKDNPSRFKGEQRPVERVSWNDCQKFLERLNAERPGLELRLPTEAEWEYACRAGTPTPFSFGANVTPEQVNYNGEYPYAGGAKAEYRRQTVEVRSLPANPWGLHEMHGNVWEWCSDWYGQYEAGPVVDPTGPERGDSRVLRGGSWFLLARDARSACRFRPAPDYRVDFAGFRFARGHE